MSRYDYRDPAQDPLYCDGLQPDDMPDDMDELTIIDPCAWCGHALPNLDWHPYCSSQCGLYAELDSAEG